jgi:ribosomal protein L34
MWQLRESICQTRGEQRATADPGDSYLGRAVLSARRDHCQAQSNSGALCERKHNFRARWPGGFNCPDCVDGRAWLRRAEALPTHFARKF